MQGRFLTPPVTLRLAPAVPLALAVPPAMHIAVLLAVFLATAVPGAGAVQAAADESAAIAPMGASAVQASTDESVAIPAPWPARGLPALLARAVPRDPQVIAAQATLVAAQARYRQARSRLLPNAGIQATGGRGSDLDGPLPVDRRTGQVEASLRWNLYNGGADLAELQAGQREVAAAEVDVRRAREESTARLAETYFDARRLERTLLLSGARLAEVGQLVGQMRRQADLGKASELDYQLAQSARLDAELVEDGLQADRAAAGARLAVQASEAVGELLDFEFGALPAQGQGEDVAQHAPLRAAQERATAARLRVRNVAATTAPKVDLDVRRMLNNNTTPPASSIQQRGWSVGISWDFPLGGENLARRDEMVSRADAADAEVLRVEQGAQADLASLGPRIASAQRALLLYDAQEKTMALLVRGGAIQFEAGRRNLQQIIQTRDNHFLVQQRRIEQRHRLLLAQLQQRLLSGQLLPAFGMAREVASKAAPETSPETAPAAAPAAAPGVSMNLHTGDGQAR